MSDEVCDYCGGLKERCWIDYPEDNNCVHCTVDKHGQLTLEQAAKRLHISLVRVSQIEKEALKKLSKRIKFDFLDEKDYL
jgi:rubredoxin